MQIINYWVEIVCAVGGFLITAIPTCIVIVRLIKQKKEDDIEIDLSKELDKLVVEAETLYGKLNDVMKNTKAGTAGEIKKKSVLTELENYAFKNGYKFDSSEWSKKIDELIEITKKVN